LSILIQTKNLSKIYKETGDDETIALDKTDLEIKEGEFVSIIGPSGSGKTTLMQILGCLDRPTSGEYYFEGKEITKYTDDEIAKIRGEKMGFVFQAFNLLPRLSVLENVKLPLLYSDTSEHKMNDISKEMIDLVGLSDRLNFKASNLSGGQKQRVAIARALVRSPKIIFADEPTGNLDSKSGAIILEFLQTLHHEKRNTIIIVTHEVYVAQSAERILHIKDGKIDKDEKVQNRRMIFKDGFIK